jgi:uronate dehydrogenase
VTVLITGAAGGVGSFLRTGLPALGWQLRCLDLVLPPPSAPSQSGPSSSALSPSTLPDHPVGWVIGDIADPHVLDIALGNTARGTGPTGDVEAIVHLAGIPGEDTFPRLRHANIDGTYQVFEAARRAGVRRVLYASSNHAVGCHSADGDTVGGLLPEDAPVRPDSLYGVSKAFGEALGRYYADRHGMAVACLRIGSCFERPTQVRHLATWLSPGDVVRLTDALLRVPHLRYATVHGISANTRAWWSLDTARALGYAPQDNAECYAAEVLAAHGELDPRDPDARLVGGRMAAS